YGKKDWTRLVPLATNAMNRSFNRAIGTSPYIIKYNKIPLLGIDKSIGLEESKISKDKTAQLKKKIISKYQKEFVRGKKIIKNDFKIGDKVLVYEKRLSDKIKACWTDGYIITERAGKDSWKVTRDGKNIVLNKSHIKHEL
ncbi:hypothetical protein COBT_001017, partial [Conglomerata obtusa]